METNFCIPRGYHLVSVSFMKAVADLHSKILVQFSSFPCSSQENLTPLPFPLAPTLGNPRCTAEEERQAVCL